ncbi:MAG TPA: AsmA-like C-terminal region-containing protein [Pseudolabrys sp.]|nr:AsmA-like C-terminal region-containing protein [Pseudolabrys sp.]
MQTTLLGLAIAIILALVTALVGPLLIDWGSYRSTFEAQATRIVGLEVRVSGAIDARLLPSPQLTLHGIEIGRGQESVRARALGLELALGPLMRGEWRATEMHLTGPQLTLGLDAAGRLQVPNLAIGLDPDALSIDRLSIDDGTLTLTDAAARSLTLDHLWFKGEVRSLLGPVKGEGATNVGGDLYPFRLSASRYGDDGKLRLRLTVDPVNHPLSAEADGALSLGGGTPVFEGTLSLRRPVGLAAAGRSGGLIQPWYLGGKVKATTTSALMQNVEFQYGAADRGFKLTGVADFKFGKTPRFDGVLSADQIDLDRALAERGGALPPAAALARLAQLGGSAFRPGIPVKIGIGIDRVTLGGDTVQNLRGDLSAEAGDWSLDHFEFRAPGFTQVRVSGRLAVAGNGVDFRGLAELKTNDPKALTAWLEGRPLAHSELRPLSLRGDITLAGDRIAADRLEAEFDRKPITGRFAYAFAEGTQPARLEANFKAQDLDIDAALAFGNALLAGADIERPHDMTIAADIGHGTVAGLDARDLSARLKVDAGGLRIDRLSVADLGGAAMSASGHIVTAPKPQGRINLDLDARNMTPVAALLARFWPETAGMIAPRAQAMAPAKLHAQLSVEGDSPKASIKLGIDGALGAARLAVTSETNVDLLSLGLGDFKLGGTLAADDGRQLLAMLGVDSVVAADAGAAVLEFEASGPAHGELHVEGTLKAATLDASASGTANPFAGKPSAAVQAAISRVQLRPFRDGQGVIPANFNGRIALAGGELTLDNIEASLAGSTMRGRLALTLAAPHRLQGDIVVDRIDGGRMIAAAVGMPAAKATGWSAADEPFTAGLLGDYAGRITVKAHSVELMPQLGAQDFGATIIFDKKDVSFADISGDIAGGRLSGGLSFRAAEDGLHMSTRFALNGADAGKLLASGARRPVTGTLALSGEMAGVGLSPGALIGSLQGEGRFILTDAQFSGLDPRVFDSVTGAVDRGLVVDQARIADLASKALLGGPLTAKSVQGDLPVSAGQVRLSKFSVDGAALQLTAAGELDLTTGAIDARLVLSGPGAQGGARPDIFISLKGPLSAPERAVDVSALTGWLTLRQIENQSKQLRTIESAPPPKPKSEAPPAAKRTPPAPPAGRQPAPSVGRGPLQLTPQQHAPALPPPVEVGRIPGRPSLPEASAVGSQR